jgi:hypothetical protein
MDKFGQHVDQEQLIACYSGERSRELLIMNDMATLTAAPRFLPWFTVDGDAVVADHTNDPQMALRQEFLLGKKICDAYVAKSGKPAPAACLDFPADDAELGSQPWQFYDPGVTNFTQLAAKHEEEQAVGGMLLSDAARTVVGGVTMWKAVLAVAIFSVLGGASAMYCVCSRGVEPEHTSFEDREKADAEQTDQLLSAEGGK